MDANFDIEMFFDGDCPLCLRETNLLRRLDRRQRIRFTNIAAADFAADQHGRSLEQLMAEMHGRLPDGSWVQGVEVFRRLYEAVGFGKIVWFTRLPLVRNVLNLGYAIFARYRLRLTGRCTTECQAPESPA